MLGLLPRPSDGLDQVRLGDLLTTGEVTRSDLGVDLDSRVWRDQVVWNVVSFENGDARVDDGVVFPGGGG